MGITENILTPARPMATMALSGFLTDSLSGLARGTVDTVDIMVMGSDAISMTVVTMDVSSEVVVNSAGTLDAEDTEERVFAANAVSAAKVASEVANLAAEDSAVKAASEAANLTAEVISTAEAAREVEASAAVDPTVEAAAHMVEVTARLRPN